MDILNDENKYVNFRGAVEVIRAEMTAPVDVNAD